MQWLAQLKSIATGGRPNKPGATLIHRRMSTLVCHLSLWQMQLALIIVGQITDKREPASN